MTEKKAIEQLKFDMEMITFDPDTGEHISLEVLKSRNEDNYKTYLADELAIKALEEIKLYHESKLSLVPSNIFEEICKENDEYKAIGTPDECREAVEKQKEIRNKSIDDFKTRLLELCSGNDCEECVSGKCDVCYDNTVDYSSIVDLAEQLKEGVTDAERI